MPRVIVIRSKSDWLRLVKKDLAVAKLPVAEAQQKKWRLRKDIDCSITHLVPVHRRLSVGVSIQNLLGNVVV